MDFKIKSIHHIKLTVSDLKISREFYENLPGFKVVANYPGFIMFYAGSFYLGITNHKGKQKKRVFDERDVGLDHVSFEVGSREDLDKAIEFFEKKNIKHGKIDKLSNNLYVLTFRDPDNIQLELTWKQ